MKRKRYIVKYGDILQQNSAFLKTVIIPNIHIKIHGNKKQRYIPLLFIITVYLIYLLYPLLLQAAKGLNIFLKI